MSFAILNCDQRSTEWRAARLGRVTGSCAHDLLTTVKQGESAARRNLRVRLVLERLTGASQESDFVSADMAHGIDTEAEARMAYEALSGNFVTTVGFLQHHDLMAGCSPDAVIGDFDGLLSIKCPKSATHLDFLKSGHIPLDYAHQNLHELWLSRAPWIDFLSFDPRFPKALRTKLVRVEARTLDLAGYDTKVRAFLAEVEAEVAALRTVTDLPAVLAAAVGGA